MRGGARSRAQRTGFPAHAASGWPAARAALSPGANVHVLQEPVGTMGRPCELDVVPCLTDGGRAGRWLSPAEHGSVGASRLWVFSSGLFCLVNLGPVSVPFPGEGCALGVPRSMALVRCWLCVPPDLTFVTWRQWILVTKGGLSLVGVDKCS